MPRLSHISSQIAASQKTYRGIRICLIHIERISNLVLYFVPRQQSLYQFFFRRITYCNDFLSMQKVHAVSTPVLYLHTIHSLLAESYQKMILPSTVIA